MSTTARTLGRLARHRRLRKRVIGVPDRPRVCVFRSHKHLYAQLIDDMGGRTLRGWSTLDGRFEQLAARGTVDAAKALGMLVAGELKQQGIQRVVFDRGGYRYHGRVKALAEALREGGIEV